LDSRYANLVGTEPETVQQRIFSKTARRGYHSRSGSLPISDISDLF